MTSLIFSLPFSVLAFFRASDGSVCEGLVVIDVDFLSCRSIWVCASSAQSAGIVFVISFFFLVIVSKVVEVMQKGPKERENIFEYASIAILSAAGVDSGGWSTYTS